MRSFFTVALLFVCANAALAQTLYYVSSNNRTGNWETASMWTKQEAWQPNPPPPTAPLNVRTSVYGYVTRNGNLEFNGGDAVMDLYDTLVITGNLMMSQGNARHITVQSGGVLIVLGDFDAGNNNTPLIQVQSGGRVVIAGDYDQQQGSISTTGPFYIYDDTPTFNWGSSVDGTAYNGSNGTSMGNSLEDENDLASNDPTLFAMVDVLLNGTCGGAQTVGTAQTICQGSSVTLAGSPRSGSPTYQWQSSTTSSSTGFGAAAGTNNAQNYTSAALTQTTWFRRVVTKAGCATNTSSAIEITVLATGTWRGTSSAVWSTGANWCGNAEPTSTTDAIIPVVTTNYPSISSTANARNITIASGAQLTVSSSTLNVFGDLTNSGTITVGGTMTVSGTGTQNFTNASGATITVSGTVNFGGSATQTITNNGSFTATSNNAAAIAFNGSGAQTLGGTNAVTANNVTFNNASANQITLQNNMTVNRGLTMTAGIVNLSNNTLSFGMSAAAGAGGIGTFTSGNARFINGTFSRWIRNATIAEGSAVLFPMGTSTDTRPIYIWVTSATNDGSLAVRHVGSSLTTSGLNINDNGTAILRRQESYWDISSGNGMTQGTFSVKAGGTGFGVVTDLTHLRFMATSSAPGTNNGADNLVFTSTLTNFLIERAGIGFTDLINNNFHIGSVNNSSSLPVTLATFIGEFLETGVELNWTTTMEKNAKMFIIEHSFEGAIFTPIGAVNANGNSQAPLHYHYQHAVSPSGKNYYRLKTVDLDETFEYSKVIMVEVPIAEFSIFPNPLKSTQSFIIRADDKIPTIEKVEFIDQFGRIAFSLGPYVLDDARLPENVSPGIYVLRIFGNHSLQTSRVVVED